MKGSDRVDPPYRGEEKATLTAFLDYHRDTLAWKCDGLTDAQLRTRAIPASNLSLVGLVRHVAEVERSWFRHGVAREVDRAIWCTEDSPDADFDDADSADIGEAFTAWQEECAAARAIVETRSLDDTFINRHGDEISLRWLLAHMIEEYARHNGHADLLRETLDGATGE